MEREPLVTVVMPCYNCQSYVGEAIESILRQSIQDFELIIVDDNSTDGSTAIIERYLGDNVRLLRHETNMGISRAMNDGIRASRAEFIARMDADDISDTRRLEEQLHAMLRDRDIAVIGTGVRVVDQVGVLIYCHANPTEDSGIREAFPSTLPIWPGSQMWRKNKLLEAGLFDEDLPFGEDLDLTLRLCLVGRAANVESLLYTYRKNISGETNIPLGFLFTRIALARRAFALKAKNDQEGLKKLYDNAASYYKKTRFEKGIRVPDENKFHYYANNALVSLIYDNKNGARIYMDKARKLRPTAFRNLLLSLLLLVPYQVVRLLFKTNRLVKRYLYVLFAGDVSAYLKNRVQSIIRRD